MRFPSVIVAGLVALALSACGGDDNDGQTRSSTTVPEAESSEDGSGRGKGVEAGTLDEPPAASGDVITAEQADGVARSVVAAWMRGDRATAERFATEPDVLDELFSRAAPSQELEDDDAYCSEDESIAGSYLGCSYTVVDDSDDGILAIGSNVEVARSLVLVGSIGFADWND